MSFKVGNLFLNLPVSDLSKTMSFFGAIGFQFNPQFTNETAACMIIGEHNFAMLVTHGFFSQYTKKAIADATQSTEVLIAISVDSRENVDRICDLALSNGGTKYSEPVDHGFMYQRAFADLDGHQWEVFWMDQSHVQPVEG